MLNEENFLQKYFFSQEIENEIRGDATNFGAATIRLTTFRLQLAETNV
jgi:hypothetical protein